MTGGVWDDPAWVTKISDGQATGYLRPTWQFPVVTEAKQPRPEAVVRAEVAREIARLVRAAKAPTAEDLYAAGMDEGLETAARIALACVDGDEGL